MHKRYHPCIDMNSFVLYTGFEENKIKPRLKELEHLRIIEETIDCDEECVVGYRMNEDSEIINLLWKLDTNLIMHSESVNKYIK